MGEDLDNIDQARIDKLIWRYAGLKPVREIAEITGLRPEEVLRRKNEMLEEVDILTIQQRRQRLLVELDGMARDARERAAGTIDEYAAGLLNASTSAIKTVLAELARAEKADNSKVESLNQKRVAELVNLMTEVVDISVAEIAENYNLDEQDLFDVFNRRMVEAAERRDLA